SSLVELHAECAAENESRKLGTQVSELRSPTCANALPPSIGLGVMPDETSPAAPICHRTGATSAGGVSSRARGASSRPDREELAPLSSPATAAGALDAAGDEGAAPT